MYEGLEANLPHTLMQFSDTPFPERTQLFPTRENVMSYLQAYAADLMPNIKLNHQVFDVKPLGDDESSEWEVKVRDLIQGNDKVERFDAIVVANGHCDWPLLPDVEGLDSWSRMLPESLQHSVSYKNAKAYQDKVSKDLKEMSTYSVSPEGLNLVSIHISRSVLPLDGFANQDSVSFLLVMAPLPRTLVIRSARYANIHCLLLRLKSLLTIPTNRLHAIIQHLSHCRLKTAPPASQMEASSVISI